MRYFLAYFVVLEDGAPSAPLFRLVMAETEELAVQTAGEWFVKNGGDVNKLFSIDVSEAIYQKGIDVGQSADPMPQEKQLSILQQIIKSFS